MIKRICQYCGKVFYTRESLVKLGGGKFCSRKCSDKGRVKNVWNRGKKREEWMSEDALEILRRKQFKKGMIPWNKGKKFPKEAREKMSASAKKRASSEEYKKRFTEFFRQYLRTHGHPSTGKKRPDFANRYNNKEEFERKRLTSFLKALIKRPTKPEQQLIEILRGLKMPFRYVGNGSYIIGNMNPDFIHTGGKKVAIEIFGDYWHDPTKNPKVPYSRTEEGRKEAFSKHGWKLIVIWERELKKNNIEEIREKIEEALKEVIQDSCALCMASYQT
jgi:G:T-mismatch repair DNA endonuclease (very short patch repair protein)